MAGETPIAKLVAELGFKIDVAKLQAFEKTLNNVEKKMASLQLSEKRDLDVRLKKLKIQEAEERLAKAQSRNKELSYLVDKKHLQVAKEQLRVEEIKERISRANALNTARIQNLQARTQATIARTSHLSPSGGAGGGRTPRRGGGGGATAAFGGGLMGWTLLSGSHLQAAAGGFGVGYGVSQVNTLVNDISSLSLSLRSITGSAEDASKALDYLKAESLRVGFDYFGAAQGYKNILAATAKTPLGARGGQQIFTGFMEYSTAYGSTEEQKQRGLNAIQQMLSKKRIYAEELTQQLSESIPGATQIFADVLAGGDTAKLRKMMEKGEGVNALEAIPKVVAAMREQVKLSGTLEARQKSLTHAQNLFRFSWISLVELLAKNGFEAGQARIFKSMSKELENSRKQIEEIGKAWANKVAPVVSNVIGYLGDILRGLWDNKEAVLGIIAVLNHQKAILIGVLAIVEDLWLYFTDKEAITVTGELTKKFETLRDVLQTIKDIVGFLKESAYGTNVDVAIKENIKGKNPAIYMTAEQIARAKASEYARGIESGAGVFGGSGSIQRTPEYRYTSPIAQKPMSPLKLEATIDLNMPDGSTQSITQMFDLTEQMSYTSGITIPYR